MTLSVEVRKLEDQSRKYFFSCRHLKGPQNMRIAIEHTLGHAKNIKAKYADQLTRSIKSNARLDWVVQQENSILLAMDINDARN